jgi:hypothetical protein
VSVLEASGDCKGGTIMRAILKLFSFAAAVLCAGCQSVHQEDLVAWEGASVSALDAHPFFLTLPTFEQQWRMERKLGTT